MELVLKNNFLKSFSIFREIQKKLENNFLLNIYVALTQKKNIYYVLKRQQEKFIQVTSSIP